MNFKIMEIASAFGPLKAFHFEVNEDHDEPCAFLEVIEHACTCVIYIFFLRMNSTTGKICEVILRVLSSFR